MLDEDQLRDLAHQHGFFSCTCEQQRDKSVAGRTSTSRRRNRIFSESNHLASEARGSRTNTPSSTKDPGQQRKHSQSITIEDIKPMVAATDPPPKAPAATLSNVPQVTLQRPIHVHIPVGAPRSTMQESRPLAPSQLRTILSQMTPSVRQRKQPFPYYRR